MRGQQRILSQRAARDDACDFTANQRGASSLLGILLGLYLQVCVCVRCVSLLCVCSLPVGHLCLVTNDDLVALPDEACNVPGKGTGLARLESKQQVAVCVLVSTHESRANTGTPHMGTALPPVRPRLVKAMPSAAEAVTASS